MTLTGVGRVLAAAQLLAQPVCAACLEVPPFPYLLLLIALPLSLHCGQPSAPLLCPLPTCPNVPVPLQPLACCPHPHPATQDQDSPQLLPNLLSYCLYLLSYCPSPTVLLHHPQLPAPTNQFRVLLGISLIPQAKPVLYILLISTTAACSQTSLCQQDITTNLTMQEMTAFILAM